MKIGKTGPVLNSREIIKLLDHVLDSSNKEHMPVCIWGLPGLGKTQIVKEYAKSKGWNFAYAAPGQFEEMGDIHGMPVVENRTNNSSEKVTRFVPPEWVPTEDCDGILLLDDINRAEERILRGLMQLFQDKGMFSWQLPRGWRIICTANPDNGQYAVSTMDDAMMTRMLHVTMEACANSWVQWASENGVDQRGVKFILTYPEMLNGNRTTPRTLVEFFNQISPIQDLSQSISLVENLAAALLDEATVGSFSAFVRNDLQLLISPEAILDASEQDDLEIDLLNSVKADNGHIRVDRISTIFERLLAHLGKGYKFSVNHRENFAKLFQMDFIPTDLKTRLGLEVSKLGTEAKKLLKHPFVSEVLMAGLK